MMTRGQVAKRLQVSIAAIRKFEGERLHPEFLDGRWVFDEAEVEALAELRSCGGGRLTTPFDGPPLLRGRVAVDASKTRCSRQVGPERALPRGGERLLQVVGELLSELDAATPAQRRRFFESNPEFEGFLEDLGRFMDDS